jgi:ribosomal-protein-alanine N-acetyltransferase
MAPIRFVPIGQGGRPAEEVSPLPDVAKDVCAATARLYQTSGFRPPWIGYLVLSDQLLVGTCAFSTPPQGGRVEIAYFTFPGFEGQGIATTMAGELIRIARAAEPGIELIAQTLTVENASNSILRKLGFQLAGTVNHEEEGRVWEWRLPAQSR